jgi:hypothetical protein
MRGHGGGIHYRGVLRMRGGIQAGLPELLLLEHQSRFLVLRMAAALWLGELLLEEDLGLRLVRLMLHGMVCLIVKGLLCEGLVLWEEGRTCVVLGLSSDI